jgi:pimeloyl-ACP methyl ester carboxylesterase
MTLLDSGAPTVRQVSVPGRRLAVRRVDPPRARPDAAAAAAPAANVPVLLLHGVPETSRCWEGLLAELGRDRTVLAPDLPGLGESEVRGPYDVRSVASSLVALLAAELDGVAASVGSTADMAAGAASTADMDTADADADAADADADADDPDTDAAPIRVDLVGHDWGGSIALAVAAARPDLVRRVVVVSAPYQKVDLLRAWHIPLLGFVPPAVFVARGRAIVRGMFRYAWRTGRPPAALVAEYEAAYAAPERVRAMAGYYRAAVRRSARSARRGPSEGAREPAARPERSLVVWGTDDPPMPLRVGEAVVSDLGRVNDPATIRMVTLPGVGHWPLEEVPDVVVPLIAEFLRQG